MPSACPRRMIVAFEIREFERIGDNGMGGLVIGGLAAVVAVPRADGLLVPSDRSSAAASQSL